MIRSMITETGRAIFFLGQVTSCILRGRIRFGEVFKQVYDLGVRSLLIIILTSMAIGVVFAMLGYVMMVRFGAKEYIAQLVVLSLVRQLSPVLTALIFSGKSGAGITAELGTMNVNDQLQATRTLGVDPIEFLVVPRMIACVIVLPILTVVSEVVGVIGGYIVGVYDANIPSAFYINQTFKSVGYVDFFSGFSKCFVFAFIIGWICSYKGFVTSGGSMGVGKYTTRAVELCYIYTILANTVLTKVILTLWG